MMKENTLALLYYPREKITFFVKLKKGELFSTHKGFITHDALLEMEFGDSFVTHKNETFYIFRPSLSDIMMNVKRHTQIIYPKDIGYILLKLGARPGDRILEAGTGSGSLSIALAYSIFPDGHLYTYERYEEFSKKAYANICMAGIEEMVTPKIGNIGETGFDETNVDSVFLDMKEPSGAIAHAYTALKPGGNIGLLVPTTNQISDCIVNLEANKFGHLEICEILLREYKINAERLRPFDRMVAHTGFLIFAKKSFDL